MQTSLELMNNVLNMKKGDRIPFCPAIYEHKGFLINKSPSQICRNAEWLYEGLIKEYETYQPDFLTIGIDVYNIEAEALGCQVQYFDDSNDVPGIREFLVKEPEDLNKLGIPDPTVDGRMPMFLEVAKNINQELGHKIKIRGAITGPYSMASELMGPENFIMLTIEDPEFVNELLAFCSNVALEYGQAYIAHGIDPIIFDSRAMPPFCSPIFFKDIISNTYKEHLTSKLIKAGAKQIPLIIGGNTTTIIDALINTGSTQLLCDFEADVTMFKQKCLEYKIPMRVNVDPRLLHLGPIKKIKEATLKILNQCADHPGFILGTGVAAYNCPPEHIHTVRQCINDFQTSI